MRVVFFGSGSFALPTLDQLMRVHDVALVVSQPDRPAGRKRILTPTPIAAFAADSGLPLIKPADVNDADVVSQIRASAAIDVVIAFGQKIGRGIRDRRFSINLHGSLLPKYRGAAPIQRAMMAGERETGVSVITLADRMDAGDVLASVSTRIDSLETAGELHDRLAQLGPDVVCDVLTGYESGTLEPQPQDESLATTAPKLVKSEGTVRFDAPARLVRCRIHGLNPWPGCRVRIGDQHLLIHRTRDHAGATDLPPGAVIADGRIACSDGVLELLSVQPPGGKTMTFAAYCLGRKIEPGMTLQELRPDDQSQ